MYKSILLIIGCFFLLFSCGKPTDPESLPVVNDGGYKIVGRLATPGSTQDVEIKNSFAFIAQGEGGLLIADISDPTNPQTVSITFENIRGYSFKIALKDTIAFIAAGTFGVTVLNTVNPDTPIVTVSNLDMKPARTFHISGNYLFTSVSEQGVKIAEISYPMYPDVRGGMSTPGYARGMTTTADTSSLLVASSEMGLSIFDISDMQNGFGNYQMWGWCDTPGNAEDVVIMDNTNYALLACGTAGLQIVDFSDSTSAHIIGSYDTGGYAKDIVYSNQKVYLTTETRGLQILSVEDINNPKLIGVVETEFAKGLSVDDNYIYIADEHEGLIIVSVP